MMMGREPGCCRNNRVTSSSRQQNTTPTEQGNNIISNEVNSSLSSHCAEINDPKMA